MSQPTEWAYEQVCRALRKHRAAREAYEEVLRTIAERECANEDECAALAERCLRQVKALEE